MNDRYLMKWGALSFLGLTGLLFLGSLFLGADYLRLIDNLKSFLTGNLSSVADGSKETIGEIIVNVGSLTLIGIFVSIIGLYTSRLIIGTSVSANRLSVESILSAGPLPLFLLIAAETVFAQQIPLGWLTKIFKGDFAFYFLMVSFNLIWSLYHIFNYRDPRDRHPLRVLPQFFAGLVDAYIFVRYGFFVTLISHFLFDVVIFSSFKKFRDMDLQHYVGSYYLIVLAISSVVMFLNQLNPFPILNNIWQIGTSSNAEIARYGFWEYLLVLVSLYAVLELVGCVLVLDFYYRGDRENYGLGYMVLIRLLIAVFTAAFILLIYWAIGLLIQDTFTKTFVYLIFVGLIAKTRSGSMMARTWFTSLPGSFALISLLPFVGPWGIFFFILFTLIVNTVPAINIQRHREYWVAT